MSTHLPVASPLEPIFEGHAAIPRLFREQFLYSDAVPYRVRLKGVMHRIWHRPRLLGPLFRLLGRMGILVPFVGTNVPTTLDVIPARGPDGSPRHRWARTFRRPGGTVRFDTTILYDARLRQVVDLVGPGDVLYMVWRARFHAPDTFTLDSEANAIRVGRRLLWLPRPLWRLLLGEVRFIQRAQPTPEGEQVTVDLLVAHPVFGEIFGYEGTFMTQRVPR